MWFPTLRASPGWKVGRRESDMPDMPDIMEKAAVSKIPGNLSIYRNHLTLCNDNNASSNLLYTEKFYRLHPETEIIS